MKIGTLVRRGLAAVLLAATLGFATAPAMAEQNTDPVNPTARSVHEEQLFDALKFGDTVNGRVTIPNKSAADLEKPFNKDWAWANLAISDTVLAAAVIVTLLAVIIFAIATGRLKIEKGREGKTITRFKLFERTVHWAMAGSFIVLALSGLNVAVGRYVVLPWLGEEAFGNFTILCKLAHNYLAFPFMLCVLLSFALWIRYNIPNRLDIEWFKAGGGLLKNGAHPDAEKFNAGQKVVFWIVVLGGTAVSLSGLLLMFPFLLAAPWQWQAAQVLHALVAAGMIAMVIGHIYIGIGSEGALEAMTTGEVDVNWAKQHHSLWYKEEMAKGEKPHSLPGTMAPAE